jgi:hypothetical protein
METDSNGIPMAVGAYNYAVSSYEIYRPVQNQKQFYLRHGDLHFMHSQIAIDNADLRMTVIKR